MTPPTTIFIQQSEDPQEVGFQRGEQVTWCEDPQGDHDVQYTLHKQFEMVEVVLKQRIADLEAQLAERDSWLVLARATLSQLMPILADLHNGINNQLIKAKEAE